MKSRSTHFYKVMILVCLALLILIPTVLSVYFGLQTMQLSDTLEILREPDSRLTLEEDWLASSSDNTLSNPSSPEGMEVRSIEYTLDYQALFPDLYVERHDSFGEFIPNSVYLTFDDGPSQMTPEILKILKEKEVKATFFVIYDDSLYAAEMLKQIVEEGHSLGVHTTSHIYLQIYSSVEAYLNDFEQTAVWIETVTGVKPDIFRFPGGSVNAYNISTYQEIIAEMIRRGYVYYDWNVSSGDASNSSSVRTVLEGVLNGVEGKDKSIVLMHDSEEKRATVQALPTMIDRLQLSGHLLLPLNHKVKPITFSYSY